MTTTNPRTANAAQSRKTAAADGVLAGRRPATGPRKRRTRSWGLVTLAALLVVGLGLGVAAWGLQVGDKTSVLAVGQPVAKGHVVERGDLVSMSVAGVSDAIPVEEIDTVVGQRAAVDLVAGQILTSAMVAADPVPGPGQSVVGLALDPTRVPSAGLRAGDQVDVIAVPPVGGRARVKDPAAAAPEVLAEGAAVYAVGGQATAGGLVLLTVVVDAADAASIAAYSTQKRVAVVETAPAPASASSGGS